MYKKENNSAFIDSQNLNLGVKKLGWELDFKKFRKYLKDKYRVQRAYLFIGFISSNKNLYSHLEAIGYKIIFKEVIEGKKLIKGNVDAELILQAVIDFYEAGYDKAVIVSGDGDFTCLVKFLKEKGVLKKIISPRRRSTSRLLTKEFFNNIEFLNDKQGILRKMRP